jgi:hypothetical protein
VSTTAVLPPRRPDGPSASRAFARRPQGPPRGEDRIADEERGARPPRDLHQLRRPGDQQSETARAGADQHDVREGADHDHGEHVLAAQALAQHEHVLRADGDDEREAREQAVEGSRHPSTLRAADLKHQRGLLMQM